MDASQTHLTYDHLETSYYRIPPGRYVRQAISIWLSQWWWAALIPIATLVVCGLWDARLYIALLCLILVVYPGLMMMVYYNYALRPEAALSLIPHKVTMDSKELRIVYQESDEYRKPKPRIIAATDITNIEDTGSSLLVHLKSGRYDFIEIPINSLVNQGRKP